MIYTGDLHFKLRKLNSLFNLNFNTMNFLSPFMLIENIHINIAAITVAFAIVKLQIYSHDIIPNQTSLSLITSTLMAFSWNVYCSCWHVTNVCMCTPFSSFL